MALKFSRKLASEALTLFHKLDTYAMHAGLGKQRLIERMFKEYSVSLSTGSRADAESMVIARKHMLAEFASGASGVFHSNETMFLLEPANLQAYLVGYRVSQMRGIDIFFKAELATFIKRINALDAAYDEEIDAFRAAL